MALLRLNSRYGDQLYALKAAVRRGCAVLSHVGGWRLDWLAGAGGFEPLHSGNQHALVYLPDLGGNVSSLGHSGPQCCTAVMPQNDPTRTRRVHCSIRDNVDFCEGGVFLLYPDRLQMSDIRAD